MSSRGQIGRRIIGNKVASGTEIIKELGTEHMRTGSLIVYTLDRQRLSDWPHTRMSPVLELPSVSGSPIS